MSRSVAGNREWPAGPASSASHGLQLSTSGTSSPAYHMLPVERRQHQFLASLFAAFDAPVLMLQRLHIGEQP